MYLGSPLPNDEALLSDAESLKHAVWNPKPAVSLVTVKASGCQLWDVPVVRVIEGALVGHLS